MDENVFSLLCISYTQLADLRAIVPGHVQQARVADLTTHFSITRRLIKNDIEFRRRARVTKDVRHRMSLARFSFNGSDCFDDSFGL